MSLKQEYQNPKQEQETERTPAGSNKETGDQPLNPQDDQRFAAVVIQVAGLWTQFEKEKYTLGTLFFNQVHVST